MYYPWYPVYYPQYLVEYPWYPCVARLWGLGVARRTRIPSLPAVGGLGICFLRRGSRGSARHKAYRPGTICHGAPLRLSTHNVRASKSVPVPVGEQGPAGTQPLGPKGATNQPGTPLARADTFRGRDSPAATGVAVPSTRRWTVGTQTRAFCRPSFARGPLWAVFSLDVGRSTEP